MEPNIEHEHKAATGVAWLFKGRQEADLMIGNISPT